MIHLGTIYISNGYYTPSFVLNKCNRYSFPFDRDCYPWSLWWPRIPDYSPQTKSVNIVLQNGAFVGSCVVIKDSESSIERSYWFKFKMNNIVISKSWCLTALSVVNSEINNNVRLSDLTIINSHNNILSVNVLNSYVLKLILTGNTSFLLNQGSVSLLSGAIKFEGLICSDFW